MSELLVTIRREQFDIDGCAENMWKVANAGKTVPAKTTDTAQLYQPMIDGVINVVAPHTPVQQSATASQQIAQLTTGSFRE